MVNGASVDSEAISSDGEAEILCSDIQGDIDDLISEIEAVDYSQAFDTCQQAQESINRLHSYLSQKVNNDG